VDVPLVTKRTAVIGKQAATIVGSGGTLLRCVGLREFLDHAKRLLKPRPSSGGRSEARKPGFSTKYVAATKDNQEDYQEALDQEFLPLHAVGGSTTTTPYKVLVINDVLHIQWNWIQGHL
jgi:hypothetical protein